MAGLQYNFFPTDFYYPRPQSLPDAPRVATAITTIQTPKKKETTTTSNNNNNINDLEWPRSLGFKVHQPQNTNPARLSCSLHPQQLHHQVEDQTEYVKYYPNPNPLLLCSFDSEELPDSP
ncbi:hypothetical protein V6N13_048952 [Hibiscus sabdariffa]|uniref:Uncharacterized protein n=1 Tax=Hibiscus sabdariffa TaxID=183260 RepID=A0ABR2QZ81_9ROSI